MPGITDEMVTNWFEPRDLDVDSAADMAAVRFIAAQLARKIRDVTPFSSDQVESIRSVRAAVRLAEDAIKTGGV